MKKKQNRGLFLHLQPYASFKKRTRRRLPFSPSETVKMYLSNYLTLFVRGAVVVALIFATFRVLLEIRDDILGQNVTSYI